MKPEPEHTRAFPTEAAFEKWLAANQQRAPHLWVRIYKQASGKRTVTYAQALDVALCWGWIDGQKAAFDEESFVQRFSPRRPKSLWSARNREHIARLTAAGRMQPSGRVHVDTARSDGRWDVAYAGQRTMAVPDDLLAAIQANKRAQATFEALDRTNRYALAFRIGALKTPAGRLNRIAAFVELLARGETLHPMKQAKAKAKAKANVK